jgi:hypothetical protein
MDLVPLVKRDEQFMKIQQLIEAKRNMLINKQKKLRFVTKQNQFLDAVKSDYVKYYNYIAQQKREQIQALQVLKDYIKDLTDSGKLTKYNIEDAKEEQNKIIKEVNSIKGNLDSIISNTKHINSALDDKM